MNQKIIKILLQKMKNVYFLFFIKNKFVQDFNYFLIYYYVGVIIGVVGGGMVFGLVVIVLVFVCVWCVVCKEM